MAYASRDEPYDLFTPLEDDELPDDRIPASGIKHAGNRYHSIPSASYNIGNKQIPIHNDPGFIETPDARSNIIFEESLDLSGSPPHPEILKIIHEWFPEYEQYLDEYCRPPSYGPQAFLDFNRLTPNPPPRLPNVMNR
jgi:hypothetical protein